MYIFALIYSGFNKFLRFVDYHAEFSIANVILWNFRKLLFSPVKLSVHLAN